MNIKKYINNLLYMSRSERNGAMVLVVIIIIVIAVRLFLPSMLKEDENYLQEIQQKIEAYDLENQREELDNDKSQENKFGNELIDKNLTKNHKSDIDIEYFEFDPNTVKFDEMLKLGFSKNTANTLEKFRLKGAKFYHSNDLLKVYGIDSLFFLKLKPFVKIEILAKKETVEDEMVEKKFEIKRYEIIEINSADSALWTSLPGIGPSYAKRICGFRNKLGGFVKIEQLKEVYNFPEETYIAIFQYLQVDPNMVKTININFAEIEDLKKHPYCNYSMARSIVDYRSKKGPFNSVTQLNSDSVIAFSDYQKLSPYLSVK